MKFAHMADCHIGAWRDPKLSSLSMNAFNKAIDISIEKNVDFILISGDLFNTSLPPIDKLKIVVQRLRELKEKKINVYIVPGSHDFSPSGKTMLDVLEKAALLTNVVKGEVKENKLCLRFCVDEKTGVKIAGMLGKKGMLEKYYYESLDTKSLEKEQGFKIFMFHTAIDELKPKELEKMSSSPISLLPKGFDYYAGGHVHIVEKKTIEGYKNIVYPGPLFPANLLEIEKLGKGGFYIYDDGSIEYIPIEIHGVQVIKIDCNHRNPEKVEQELNKEIEKAEVKDKIVVIRLFGTLDEGKPGDINFNNIIRSLYQKGAYYVMRNTFLLKLKEFEEIKIEGQMIEEIEEKIIEEQTGKTQLFDKETEKALIKELIKSMDVEKKEGERVSDFEERVIKNVERVLRI